MFITWQTIITAAAVVSALTVIITLFVKVVRFIDRQKKQDTELSDLRSLHNADMASMKKEQTLLVYGILACLKGLKEQGCNGPVTEAINKIEKHLNENAHK
jgi:predicted MarR family transcription regulator